MANFTQHVSNQLPHLYNWDRDVWLGIVHSFQTYYCITSMLTVHPLVLYLLLWESSSPSKEIRRGYIANQLALIFYEWDLGLIIRAFPLCPYPAFHCAGWLCGRGIHPQILLTILAVGVILIIPPFQYLLIVMHQKLVENTTSRIRISKRTQNIYMVTICLLLLANIAGFGILGRRTPKADEILARPDLAWLAARGGDIFIFGDIGDPETFALECYFLGIGVSLIFPITMFLSLHAIYIIMSTKRAFTSHTMRMQIRLITVLLIQLVSVFNFYALPLAILMGGIMFGTMNLPVELVAVGRSIEAIQFLFHPTPLSLIFLLKNQSFRRIIWNNLRKVLIRLSPCIARTTATVPNDAFSHLTSSSITRPNDA